MSELCKHEWKEIEHEEFNRVCIECNLLTTVMSLVDQPRCKKCGCLYAVETSKHQDYCDSCYDELEQEMQESMTQMFDAEGNNQ